MRGSINSERLQLHRSGKMASNRNAISTELRGIEDGTAFDDSLEREGVDDVTLTRIDVWAGEYISSLAVSI